MEKDVRELLKKVENKVEYDYAFEEGITQEKLLQMIEDLYDLVLEKEDEIEELENDIENNYEAITCNDNDDFDMNDFI